MSIKRLHAVALLVLSVALAGCSPTVLHAGGSIDSAYRAGHDYIELSPGQYGGQTLPQVSGHAAALVLCKPGAVVNGLAVYGDDVEFRGCDFNGQVYVEGSQRLRFRRDDFGPATNTNPLMVHGIAKSGPMEILESTFHDAKATGDAHQECAWLGWIEGLTILRSDFRRCTYFDVFLTQFQGSPPSNVRIEDNTLCASLDGPLGRSYYSVMVAEHIDRAVNYTIRGNRLGQPIAFVPKSSVGAVIGPNATAAC